MPPKKKKKVESESEDDGSGSGSDTGGDTGYKWQVQLAGQWSDLEPSQSDLIEKAFGAGKSTCDLPPQRGQKYLITFTDMKQTNTTTPPYKKRPVQRVPKSAASTPAPPPPAKKKPEPKAAKAKADDDEEDEEPAAKKKKPNPKDSGEKLTADTPLPKREDATCELKDVPKDCEEFWDLEEKFASCLQGRNDDYVKSRLEKKKKPLSFIVKSAQRVVNPVLTKRFEIKKLQLLKEIPDKATQRERTSFHGSHPKNIGNICKTSLLRFQHPMNPCKVQSDEGWFGTNKKGVYVSRYADYTFKYANRGAPLDAGETTKVIMFRTMPGKTKHIQTLAGAIDPTPGFHSHASPSFLEWYLFDEDQALPEYVVEVLAREDTRTASDDQ